MVIFGMSGPKSPAAYVNDPPQNGYEVRDCLGYHGVRLFARQNAQHSTKKKNFGKWVPDDIPENLGISGYAFRSFLDVSIFEPQISLNEARRLQRLYRQETILAITQDGGVTLI